MRLQDRVAIVTGAASGIGRCIAQTFAEAGAKVAVADIDTEGAEQTRMSIENRQGSALVTTVDVSEPDQAARMVEVTVSAFGQVDILVNSAGMGFRHSFLEAKPDDFMRVIKLNLAGTFFCAQAAAREMVKRNYGRIINIASIAGERAGAGRTAYGPSKAGVMGVTRQAALELGPLGITANAIAPGPIDTPATRAIHNDTTRESYERLIPVGRYGTVDEIADAALFLAGERAGYVNGQILFVDGGYVSTGISNDFAGETWKGA